MYIYTFYVTVSLLTLRFVFTPPHFVDFFVLVIPKHCYLPYFFHKSTEHSL